MAELTLSGTISSAVGQLTSLTALTVASSSGVHGTLPPAIGSLSNLVTMEILNNTIHGTIPLEFNQLTSLEWIQLDDNKLTGSVPDIFYNLQRLSTLLLNNNSFSGNFPPSVCALTNVDLVWIYGNNFSCYPSCLLNAPNPGTTLPVANPNALIPGGGGATYGSKTGNLTRLTSGKSLDPVGNNTCLGKNCIS